MSPFWILSFFHLITTSDPCHHPRHMHRQYYIKTIRNQWPPIVFFLSMPIRTHILFLPPLCGFWLRTDLPHSSTFSKVNYNKDHCYYRTHMKRKSLLCENRVKSLETSIFFFFGSPNSFEVRNAIQSILKTISLRRILCFKTLRQHPIWIRSLFGLHTNIGGLMGYHQNLFLVRLVGVASLHIVFLGCYWNLRK